MPERPKRPCARPGCPELVDSGYCEAHRKREEDRPNAGDRGYGAGWRKARLRFIADQARNGNVVCADCGRPFASESDIHVDHIKPHCGDQKLFWDRSNWQMLCQKDHAAKTARGL
jgi:5-methylcytosine-specific restriction protein A